MRKTLITGATSGLGRALINRLAISNELTAIGRNQKKIKELLQSGHVKEALAVDLSDTQACLDLLKDRPLDVLINNAGVLPHSGHLDQLSSMDINAMIDVNLRAVIHLTRAAIIQMKKQGSGHIVFIGSSAGHYPHPGSAVYGATKAAIALFSDALRAELLGKNIRISEVAPGRIRSNLYRDAIGSNASAKLYDEYEPLEPEDVADAIAYMLDTPAHVSPSRLEIFPTCQAVGGGRIIKKSAFK